jgi:hypothetical protein
VSLLVNDVALTEVFFGSSVLHSLLNEVPASVLLPSDFTSVRARDISGRRSLVTSFSVLRASIRSRG